MRKVGPDHPPASASQRAAEAAANMTSEIVQASSWGRRRTSHRSRAAAAKAVATSVAVAAKAASTVTGAILDRSPVRSHGALAIRGSVERVVGAL